MAFPCPRDQRLVNYVPRQSAKPFVPFWSDNQRHVCHVTRSEAPGNRELNRAVELLLLPDCLEPPDWHLWVPSVGAPATAPLAEHQLRQGAAICDRRAGHTHLLTSGATAWQTRRSTP